MATDIVEQAIEATVSGHTTFREKVQALLDAGWTLLPPTPAAPSPAIVEDTAPGQPPAEVNPLLAGRVTVGDSYNYPTIDLGEWK